MPKWLGCLGGGGGGDTGGVKEGEEDNPIPKPRGCTDTVWLICYVIFCCVLILIAAFALVYGNPKRLINGMDSFGNVCGTGNENFGGLNFSGMDMTDKPFVFFFDLNNMDLSTKVCVSQCPEEDIEDMEALKEYSSNVTINYCRYDFNISEWTKGDDEARKEGHFHGSLLELDEILCPKFPIYASHPILKRCVPVLRKGEESEDVNGTVTTIGRFPGVISPHKLFSAVYGYLNGLNIFQQVLGDLALTWDIVLGLTAVSFVISLMMVVILHWITTLVAYLILILSGVLSIAFTSFLWYTYFDLKRTIEATRDDMLLDEMCRNEASFFTYSILATIFTLGLLLIILVIRKRVPIIVKLFREAGKAVVSMPCLWVQPFITYGMLTAFFFAWLYVILCIATSDYPSQRHVSAPYKKSMRLPLPPGGEIRSVGVLGPLSSTGGDGGDEDDVNGTSIADASLNWDFLTGWTLIEYSDEAWVKYMWFFYIFGLIWCSEFILACQQFVIASSVATWYFSKSRSNLNCVVFKSIMRMIKYHVGSIALGSLIITIIKVPRLIVQFSQRIFRKWDDYRFVQWINKACACCLRCFEGCMKYVHHNAYTVISIQGVNFCPASRLAFSALMQNALQIAVINSIGDFVLFLAKCVVACLTGLIAILVFRSDETLYYYAIPVLLTIVFSYFVAHCVISVFEMAVDTLFLCFCEDHNMNDGTDGKEFYAPRSLLQYMTVDVVDAVAPGRRDHLASPSNLKSQIQEFKDPSATPEEIIPMNPYNETTEPAHA